MLHFHFSTFAMVDALLGPQPFSRRGLVLPIHEDPQAVIQELGGRITKTELVAQTLTFTLQCSNRIFKASWKRPGSLRILASKGIKKTRILVSPKPRYLASAILKLHHVA